MSFEPEKFFVGLMDFFSILLPGALLTFVIKDTVGPAVLGGSYQSLTEGQGAGVFFFASYLLGHFIFLAGSWLDLIYDGLVRHTHDQQIARLARGGVLSDRTVRFLVWLVCKHDRRLALHRAVALRRRMLQPVRAEKAINTFQWAKVLLALESPANLALVNRFEADSKFFRCLVVVLVVLLGWWLAHGQSALTWGAAAILPPALWRYMEQRFKATNQAYWAALTVTAQAGKVSLPAPADPAGTPTHAGGVVYRWGAAGPEFLFVSATGNRAEWVLPKGHVEVDEREAGDLRLTAVREVLEEAAVWAKVVADLGTKQFQQNTVQFYLMRLVEPALFADEPERRSRWLTLAETRALPLHTETRELLAAATSAISRLTPSGVREPASL